MKIILHEKPVMLNGETFTQRDIELDFAVDELRDLVASVPDPGVPSAIFAFIKWALGQGR